MATKLIASNFVGSSPDDVQEFLVNILQASTDYSLIGMGLDGTILLWNEGARRLYGYEPGDLLGQARSDILYTPEDIAAGRPREIREAALRDGRWEGVLTRVRKDGRRFPARAVVTPFFDASGRHVGYLLISKDITNELEEDLRVRNSILAKEEQITELRRLEEQFQQAQRRLQHVVASSPAVLFTVSVAADQTPGITWTSDNLPEVLGCSPEAALSQNWWMGNIHPEDRDQVLAQFQANLLSQERSSYEYRFRHGDGSYRWTRCDLRVIRDRDGKAGEVVGSWSDITERKHLEDQFRQAQKMEAVGRLASGVAHDFNNLLTVISGYTEIVINDLPIGDPSRELVDEIRKAGERGASLTRQLLAFGRKTVLQPSVLDLNAVLIDSLKMLHRLVGADIELATVLAPSLGRVKADPSQFEQAIFNLAVNARDAMSQGGKLTFETANVELDTAYCLANPEARPGHYVMVAVRDNGSGMSAETKARIFEPFFTTKEPGKGTGLGLAMVFGFIKQIGGHIAVDTELKHGTTFKLYFPQIGEAMLTSPSVPGVKPIPHGTETILLVEDEDAVRVLARHVLRMCGYTVLEASHGGEALRVVERHQGPIHLLLTDVVMPGMVGHIVAERVAALKPGIKIVFTSGYTDEAVVRHGILETETHFLQKPYTPAAVARKVREVLDGGVERRPARTDQGSRTTTILVIDDDEQFQNYLRRVLEEEGYVVRQARNGLAGIRAYEKEPADLVICDIFMDLHDGLETIQQLLQKFPHAKIIAVSGGSTRIPGDYLHHAGKFGAVATLSKPLDLAFLLQTMKDLLMT